MNTKFVKIQSVYKVIAFIFAVLYGFFTVATLERLFTLDSGDVNSLVDFFDANMQTDAIETYGIAGDGLFRLIIIFLGNFFGAEPKTVLSIIAFLTSSITFLIFSTASIKSKTSFINFAPLFLIVFLTPMVTNLYASGIRSGISFTLLMAAFVYFRGITRYALFGLSSLIHLSMLPILALYILFHTINKIKIRSVVFIPLTMLLVTSFSIAAFNFFFKINIILSAQSFYYNFMIFYLALLLTFINRKAITNIYGFLAIGMIYVYLFGLVFEISFIRYVGNSIILYLFFLIRRGGTGAIHIFTLGYIPFFVMGVFFAFANFA